VARILVVEQRTRLRALVAQSLERRGHRVRRVRDAAAARDDAAAFAPDLLFAPSGAGTDPEGLALARELRDAAPEMCCVLLRAPALSPLRRDALARQVDAVVDEPLCLDALATAVEAALARRAEAHCGQG